MSDAIFAVLRGADFRVCRQSPEAVRQFGVVHGAFADHARTDPATTRRIVELMEHTMDTHEPTSLIIPSGSASARIAHVRLGDNLLHRLEFLPDDVATACVREECRPLNGALDRLEQQLARLAQQLARTGHLLVLLVLPALGASQIG